jgi:hypothetical protein
MFGCTYANYVCIEEEEQKKAKPSPPKQRVESAVSGMSKQTYKPSKPFDDNFVHNTELFFCKWEENESNDKVRIELLNDFINIPELRLNLFKRKQEFLICLNQ